MAATSPTTGAMVPFPPTTVGFNAPADIQRALAVEGVGSMVAEVSAQFQTINIAKTMEALVQAGNLLRLAYAGSNGFKCSVSVIAIMADYQQLSKNSLVTSGVFVRGALEALKYHQLALKILERAPQKATELIGRCGQLAKNMADEAGKVVEQAQNLVDLAKTGLSEAVGDRTITQEQRQRVERELADFEAMSARLKQETQDLSDAVERERDAERREEAAARKAEKRAFVLGLVSAVAVPIMTVAGAAVAGPAGAAAGAAGAAASASGARRPSEPSGQREGSTEGSEETEPQVDFEAISLATKNLKIELAQKRVDLAHEQDDAKKAVLEKEIAALEIEIEEKERAKEKLAEAAGSAAQHFTKRAEEAASRAASAAGRRAAVEKELRQANASLAESVSRLSSSRKEKDTLETAITSLEITVKTLGKIVTTFQNTRLFWLGVEKQCEALTSSTDVELFAELEMVEELGDAIRQSGINWLSLAVINETAFNAIKAADAHFDSVMNDIPTREESAELLTTIESTLPQILELEG